MSASVGYQFAANTKARASQVNENFEWFRGNYLPITQSGTWATTNSVMDLGSLSFHWANAYIDTFPSHTTFSETVTIADLTATNITVSTLTATSITVATLTATSATIADLTVTASITLPGAVWPSFDVQKTSDQIDISRTSVKIEWDVKNFDTNDDFTTTTNRFNPQVEGKYLLSSGIVSTVSGATVRGGIELWKNGSLYRQDQKTVDQGRHAFQITTVVDANGSTDYFEMFIFLSNASGSIDVKATTTGVMTYFSGSRIA